MRYAELRNTGDAWRVWLTFESEIVPEGDATLVRYVALAPNDTPSVYDRYEDGAFVTDGWLPAPPPLPEPPAPITRMSKLAFQSRYTVAEQVAIELAADGSTQGFTAAQRATLRVLDRALQNANEVDLADPRTVQGVQTHVAMGLLSSARATEILDPAWTPA